MQTNLLYIGPLRPETLTLLEALPPAEHALFVTPTPNAPLWEVVQGLFPQAKQQVIKVAEASGELPYYEYNLPEFNASQPASGLYTLYPGLELLESSPLPLVGVEALLSEIQSATDTIVIEQPELVWPLLEALAALPGYKRLSELWIRVGALPLYESMPEAEEIRSWCQKQGFELQVTNEDDPDLPLLQLARHPYYDRWQEEAQRAAKLNEQLKVAQQQVEEQQAVKAQFEALQQAHKQLQAQYAEQENQLTVLQEKLNQQQALQTAVSELQKTMHQKFDEQHVFMKETANALGQHITRRTADQ
ncbi:hypothetical protein ACT3R7_06470 [Halomonas sp. AOP43-A1-21]